MTNLFISHSHVDDDLASAVATYLRESDTGLNPIQLSRGIRSAQDWSDRIRSELRDSDAALFLVTPHYIARPAWLFMEWAAAWVQDIPPHLLLVDVNAAELPDVMRETQITFFDGNTASLARNLLSVLTGLGEADARCINLATQLVATIGSESAKWEEAKWQRVTADIAGGTATLADSDLEWIVEKARVGELVDRVLDDFAHPALVHKVARYLLTRGYPQECARLAPLLPGHIQVALFSEVVGRDPEAARAIAAAGADRRTLRDCGANAAAQGNADLAEAIADLTDYAYDKRVIAERLLAAGRRDHAQRVIAKADKGSEKSAFALAAIAAGDPDLALEVASTITLNHVLRQIGERLVDAGNVADLARLVEHMDKNHEKRRLAVYAVERRQFEAAETVAATMNVSAEILAVAKEIYDASRSAADSAGAELALKLLFLMKRNEERRQFMEHVLQDDPEAAVRFARQALETDGQRRRFVEVLGEAGLQAEALTAADLLGRDEDRERIFWFALAHGDAALADAVSAALTDPSVRARCEAVKRAWAAAAG
jgi:hypothetical protein